MRTWIIIIMCIFIFLPGCSFALRVDGPYEGRIIDADTRESIEGVVVLGTWSREYPTVAGARHEYHDAEETVTDENGEFIISGKGLLILSNVMPPYFHIFKAGYSYEGGTYSSFREFAEEIKWEGEKAIIPLKKLTMEERKKSLGTPSPPHEAPLEKVILMLKEMDKDDIERGLEPRGIWRGEKYE